MGAKDSKPCCITYEEAVKRVTDAELKRLKEAFKRVSTLNGCITKQSFIKDVLGEGVPTPVAEYIFTACGGTQKGIALKDLLCGLVLLTRGREEEKLKFLFGLYSNESGSYVVRDELQRMLQACENGYVPDSIASLFSEYLDLDKLICRYKEILGDYLFLIQRYESELADGIELLQNKF